MQAVGCECLFMSLQEKSQHSLPLVKIPLQIITLPLKTNYIYIQELMTFQLKLSFQPFSGELEIRGSDSLNTNFPFHLIAKPCRFLCTVVKDAEWCLRSSPILSAHEILSNTWKYGCRN